METPRSEQFDDIYFAVEDGLAESKYVFLEQNNLPAGWDGRDRFTICETGFGTGLNFLLAWTLFEKTANSTQQLTYISFEKYPLSKDEILKYLSHWSGEFDGRLERLADIYPLRVGGWHKIRVSGRVTLLLIFDDVNRALPELDAEVDCWFLDGHAPAKNPDMWSDVLFSHIGRLSRVGARVATFTAAGFVRRGLEGAGFQVSKTRGFGRKRDMTVGVFAGDGHKDVACPCISRVAVIGGGIAGASVAAAFVSRGVAVDLFEKTGLASGGSGNVRGLFNPRFTVQKGNESDFYSSAFSLAVRAFEDIQKNNDIGYARCGSLHLVTDEAKDKRFAGFLKNWGWHKDHAHAVSQDEASAIAGVDVKSGGVFLPDAGIVAPYKVVGALAGQVNVIRKEILSLDELDDYDVVVLAGAADVVKFPQAASLPVSTVRGQVSVIETLSAFSSLKTNLCYGGYASVPFDGQMVVGSTFQPWLHDLSIREEDHTDVLQKLSDVVDGFGGDARIVAGRAAFRCASKDRVPVIGQLADGLYISAAHGSHGLITSLLGAEMIAAQVAHEILPVPQNVVRYVSPERFKIPQASRRTSSH